MRRSRLLIASWWRDAQADLVHDAPELVAIGAWLSRDTISIVCSRL